MPGLRLTKRLNRIVGQIKFRPTLLSWENTLPAAHSLEDKYQNWKLNKASDILLLHNDDKKILRAEYNTITCSNEKTSDTSELVKHLDVIYTKSIKESEVKTVSHIGFRYIQIFGCTFSFSELSELMYEKFYKKDAMITISTDAIRDTAFILNGEKNGLLNNVKIGPMEKDEALQSFNSIFDMEEDKMEEPSYLYVDTDVFVRNFDPSNGNFKSIIEKLIAENIRIAKEYVGYIEQINEGR